jgi:hypothetical protein
LAARYLRFQLHAAGEPREAPLLQRLLARADEAAAAVDWRADAFHTIAPQTPMPAVAAAAYRAAGGPRAQGWVTLATPVHYLAEISNVRFASDGILSLDPAEAAALASGFNGEWQGSGVDLWAASSRLFCGFDTPIEASTQDPELVRGRHLQDFLPAGPDAVRLRRLMSEMEMWLFDHDLNRARRQRAQLPVSALWLWGGGAPLRALPAVQGGAAGGDVFFDAFPARAGRGADVMVADSAPGRDGWSEVEAHWLAPALADLRRGAIAQLELAAGERRFIVGARWRRRFWRRAQPWWEYFE